MRKISLSLLALPIMAMQCKEKKDCSSAICTEMFAAVNVAVTDKNNNQLTLDDYYTMNTVGGDTLRFNNSGWPDGSYTVLDDSYTSKMYNQRFNFRFVGIKDGKVIADEPYTISADCCHISKESGKEKIVIE